MITRRLLIRCAGGLVAFVAAYVGLVHPAAFPQSLGEPSFQLDPAEGHVWLTSEVTFEVRGHLSEKEALAGLHLTPPVALESADIAVEHVALLPWHENMPWAKTRVHVNPRHAQIFQSETSYSLAFESTAAEFRTITLPRVVQFEAQNPPAPDLASVPTRSAIVLRFNEPLRWNDGLIKLDPPAPFTTQVAVSPEGATVVSVMPAARWDNGTNYTVRVDATVEDVHGHTGGQVFAQTFTTEPKTQVIAASPIGESAPAESAVRIDFDRDVDHTSVGASFRTDPPLPGSLTWVGERSLVWWPEQSFPNSSYFKISIAGNSPAGDTIVPHEWTFRTQDPPVFVEIRGSQWGPAVLEGVATGGLGNYTYEWSTGSTASRFLMIGSPGEQTVGVTVHSGDRSAAASIQFWGQPAGSFTPSECPQGWYVADVSVCFQQSEVSGSGRTFLARIDLKDPGRQVRSRLSGERLGDYRTVSQAAAAHGAVAAINGDFFYAAQGGLYPLGPVMFGGSLASAPATPEAMLAFNRDRAVWVGSATELRFQVYAADGSSIAVQGVNDIPKENAISIFNAKWGSVLSLGAEGCQANFFQYDGAARPPDQFACGALTGVGVPANGYSLVARGASAQWLADRSGMAMNVGYAFPLANTEFVVGGSHVLMQGGTPMELPQDRQHPRSMVGVDANGFMYLVAVEGRTEDSGGMTLLQLQAYAAQLGLTNAINLDGGGSTAMAIGGSIVNAPSDGRERAVASVIEAGLPLPPCRNPFVGC